MTNQPLPEFPADFRWGVSTSSYQIEGAATEDGRGPSIWDTFSHAGGHIGDGSTGDVACDHYHRYADDVALMAGLGVRTYRFSIAWPRVQPTGSGPANPAGLAFYDRLVDTLLSHGIEPAATLFHWDLPQPLQDAGGWTVRDTAARFGEYADIVARTLGDRVRLWLTLNEPVVHLALGHLLGLHAPGLHLLDDPFPVVHHQLLGHGLATAAVRRHGSGAVGIANNYTPAWAVGADGTRGTADDADRAAAAVYDAFHNRLFTDPLLLGRYPAGIERLTGGDPESVILDGDLRVISAPLDALGVNYYNPTGVSGTSPDGPLPFELTALSGYPTTAFGWPVVPAGLTELLVTLHRRYGDRLPPIWITENGCCYDDVPGPDGTVADPDRIAYLDGHVRAVRAAMDAGVRVDGYCLWSLLDNWEWAEGFTKRFGLVHVDFATQRRTPKASYAWYRDLVARSR
ncbi:GH1 family beta-glucosidase [Planosporangium sp. 12N6]|uniref:GH1 family beta-glucosidase n=1 Tax=Planosporangium spinosum TaxID=3402278 RepID=UPI003CF483FC